MMNAEQIFQAIQSLPLSERRGLLDRLNKDIHGATAARTATEAENLDLIGFLADEPEIADEIEKIATVERAFEDMRSFGDATGSSR